MSARYIAHPTSTGMSPQPHSSSPSACACCARTGAAIPHASFSSQPQKSAASIFHVAAKCHCPKCLLFLNIKITSSAELCAFLAHTAIQSIQFSPRSISSKQRRGFTCRTVMLRMAPSFINVHLPLAICKPPIGKHTECASCSAAWRRYAIDWQPRPLLCT